jgi:S-(hydroxymethyl)glutathione dehydrogenase/alcohol dehydrogenase
MTTCKAAIALGNGQFKIEHTDLAAPGPDEVLVRMKAAGLCHTDYDSLSWGKPIVMGHEGAGIVAKVGAEVFGFSVDDSVLLNWATPCKQCFQCQEGNQHLCEDNSPVVAGGNGYTPGQAMLGSTRWRGQAIERSFNLGTLSEYTLVKASALVKAEVPDLNFSAASLISCGVMTGFGSVVNAARVKAGSSVVILGCGGVGLNVIQGARIAGAARIIAIDIHPGKLELARKFGATELILADQADQGLRAAAQKVHQICEGRGADYAFECTAIPELGAAPLAMIRHAGMAVQVSGIEQDITIDMRLFEWDKVYINPLYGQCRPEIDFPRILHLYQQGTLLLEELVSQEYPLEDLEQAFADMLAGKNAKGVIIFPE